MSDLVFLHHQYGKKHEQACLNYLLKISNFLGPDLRPIIIITDNKPTQKKMKDHSISNNIHFLKASNQYKEFSGWQTGLDYVRDQLKIDSFNLIVSNDTFFTHRVFDNAIFLAFIAGFKKCFHCNYPAACGQVDSIDARPPYILDSVNEYISTYLWAINAQGISRIDKFINPDIFQIFNNKSDLFSIFDFAKFNRSEYINFIEELLYKSSKRKHKWHGFKSLDINNLEAMKLKAFSILNEHWLSAVFRLKEIEIIDISVYIKRSGYSVIIYRLNKALYSIKWRIVKLVKNV
ncbi:hypothetical protein G6657_08195 [Polynucleobacter paneuropaeus]|nr:hypothetical protein [Polynucleobacter paneuropaeus]